MLKMSVMVKQNRGGAYISRLVMLQIANGKLSEEAIVVFLSELVIPRRVVRRLGGVIVLA